MSLAITDKNGLSRRDGAGIATTKCSGIATQEGNGMSRRDGAGLTTVQGSGLAVAQRVIPIRITAIADDGTITVEDAS